MSDTNFTAAIESITAHIERRDREIADLKDRVIELEVLTNDQQETIARLQRNYGVPA
jgi:enamine deaminase RidA (YjgF/YER057c/UK114 family)